MRFAALACSLAFSLVVPGPTPGQIRTREKPDLTVIPMSGFVPQSGLVGVIEGDVTLERAGAARHAPKPKDPLESGDVVRTEGRGRAEILLNPGYYLRLFDGAEVVFLDLSPSNLKTKVSRGSVILEVSVLNLSRSWAFESRAQAQEVYELVTVLTPQGPFVITEGGLYRFDVAADGASELTVTKGLADVGGHRIEPGTKATVRNGAFAVTGVAAGSGDDFDRWSLERSESLVRFNKSLESADWYKQMQKNWKSHFEIDDAAWAEEARERAIVSATPGLVMFVEDGVDVRRGESEWARPGKGDRLRFGDRVRTDPASRAEIQLYPNCRLYLSGATEVVYLERPGKGIAISVARGSASIVSGIDRSLVTFVAPGTEYELARAGVYRLNVAPNGASELLVHDGRVRYARGDVGQGRRIAFRDGAYTVESVDKRSRDSFDVWSKQQAASSRFVGWPIALLRQRRAEYGGMWYFEKASGAYTFVPGQWEYRSAYGRKYEVRFRTWDAYQGPPSF